MQLDTKLTFSESNLHKPGSLILYASGSKYIGRAEIRLSVKTLEPVPKDLALDVPKVQNSSVARHLVNCGRLVDPRQAYRVINRQLSGLRPWFTEGAAFTFSSLIYANSWNLQPVCLPCEDDHCDRRPPDNPYDLGGPCSL